MSDTGTSGRRAALNWALTILFNIVLPLFTYFTLVGNGVSEVPALLISGAWPVLELGISLAVSRHIDEFSIISILFIALGVVAGLGFNSARLVLVKESVVTGLFGVVTLVSLALPRPLMFYFGRKFATDGSAAGVAAWNALWQYPSFRRTQRVITIVWGVAFVIEAAVRIALTYALSTDTMAVVSAIAPWVVLVGLITWTISYGRRARARAAARSTDPAAAEAVAPAQA